MGYVSIDKLKPGMTIKSDVADATGRLLIRGGTTISEANIRMFANRGVEEVDVEGVEEKVAEADAGAKPEAAAAAPPTASAAAPAAPTAAPAMPPPAAPTMGAPVAPPAPTPTPAAEIALSPEDENKIKIMRAIPFFNSFTVPELAMILRTGSWLKSYTGDIILREGGASGRSFFVILKGGVCIQKRVGGSTMKKTIRCLKKGECFGEMSVITGEPRSADAVADGETFVLKIDAETLTQDTDSFDMRSIQFKFYKAFSEILAQRLAQTDAIAIKPV